jgi:hypothetical protein
LTEAPRLGFWQLGHLHPSCLGFFWRENVP